jgi:hypothetical protein
MSSLNSWHIESRMLYLRQVGLGDACPCELMMRNGRSVKVLSSQVSESRGMEDVCGETTVGRMETHRGTKIGKNAP